MALRLMTREFNMASMLAKMIGDRFGHVQRVQLIKETRRKGASAAQKISDSTAMQHFLPCVSSLWRVVAF